MGAVLCPILLMDVRGWRTLDQGCLPGVHFTAKRPQAYVTCAPLVATWWPEGNNGQCYNNLQVREDARSGLVVVEHLTEQQVASAEQVRVSVWDVYTGQNVELVSVARYCGRSMMMR